MNKILKSYEWAVLCRRCGFAERAGGCDPLTHGRGLSPRSCNLNCSRAYRWIPLPIIGVFALLRCALWRIAGGTAEEIPSSPFGTGFIFL